MDNVASAELARPQEINKPAEIAEKKGPSVQSKFQKAKTRFKSLAGGIKQAFTKITADSQGVIFDAEQHELSQLSQELDRLDNQAATTLGIASEQGQTTPHESLSPVKEARHQSIDKIITMGLKSSDTLSKQGDQFLGSIDKAPQPVVFGRLLKPESQYRDQTHFQNAVDQALYTGDDSCLPVVTERPGESSVDRHLVKSTRQEREKISDRVCSSFLVVCKSEPNNLPEAYSLTRTEDQTTPENFSYLVFPEQILKDYEPNKITDKGIKVKSVSKTVDRSLLMGDRIKMPDYEGAVKEISRELNSPIWIHAVRLPSSADIKNK